jgi:hypothetical protein
MLPIAEPIKTHNNNINTINYAIFHPNIPNILAILICQKENIKKKNGKKNKKEKNNYNSSISDSKYITDPENSKSVCCGTGHTLRQCL